MFRRIVACMVVAVSLLAQQRTAPQTSSANSVYAITGVLVDTATGQPIRRARVAIAPITARDAFTTVITGDDGLFAFTHLAPGKYTLTAQRRGYLTRSFNQHEQFSSSIAVGSDLDSSNLVFRLPAEGTISGRISDEAGESVRNAQVMLYQTGTVGGEQGTRLRQRMVTDEEGMYHVGHLPPGKYLLAVTATVWYAQRPIAQKQSFSTVYSGGLNRSVADSGTYPEEDGVSPLDVAYPITYYPGVTEPGAATPLVIKPGDRLIADLALQPVQALHIRIRAGERGGQGEANNFLRLESRPFDSSPVQIPSEVRVLGTGDLDVVGVPAGRYQVDISGKGDSRATSKSGELEAASSGEVNVENEVPAVAVSAAVQMEPATAVPPQGMLRLYNLKTQEYVNEQVPGSGEVEFKRSLPPGRYELSVNSSDGEFIKSFSATGATASGRTMEIKGPGPVKLNVILARGQGKITGVALREGKPLAGAMIVLVPANARNNQTLFRRDQSDSDGTFNLLGVVPGKYTLLAIENGWDIEWLNPEVLRPYLAAGEALQVQPDGKYDVKVNVQ